MIVRPLVSGVQLITQPDHAHLAGAIMSDCDRLSREPRADAILWAVHEHDNGWREEDRVPIRDPDTGRVVDFITAPMSIRQRVWPRGITRLSDDPWVAALVAQHALTVYARFRAVPEWQSFFGDIEGMRNSLLRQAEGNYDDLLADYSYVRLGDLISLAFCTGTGDELGYSEWSVRLEGTSVLVNPDPFGGKTVAVAVTARTLPGDRFDSDAELQSAWHAAEIATLRADVKGA